jgi:hypothetical protein
MAPDPRLSQLEEHLVRSLEAVRTAANEARLVVTANPAINSSGLIGAIARLLDTQTQLFVAVQDLISRPESLIVAPAMIRKRTGRDYNYFEDLRRELAAGGPQSI